MGPLALHIVLLMVIDLTGIESVVFRQSIVTSKGKKSSQNQSSNQASNQANNQASNRNGIIIDSSNKRLGEECNVDGQCQHFAFFSACTPSGDVSVCNCVSGFARKIGDPTKCVPVAIEVEGNILLTNITWVDDMLVEGTEAFNITTAMVTDVLLDLEEVIEIKEIYIVKNISVPRVHYDMLIYNDAAEQPDELKRWMVTNKQERADHVREKRQLPETIEENMMYRINEMAYFRGIDVNVISTDIITGKLGSLCIEDSDCTTTMSSCMDSACSCTQGPIKILGDELYCSEEPDEEQ